MRLHPLKLFLLINVLACLAALTSEGPGTRTVVAPLFAAAALACVGCLHREGTRLPPHGSQPAPLHLRRRTE